MKKILFTFLLLFQFLGFAQADEGLFRRNDCTTIPSPVTNKTFCLQLTGTDAGALKYWNGTIYRKVPTGDPKPVVLGVFDWTTTITTGDGAFYFPIPSDLDGMDLIGVSAQVVTVSSSGAINIDLDRCAVVATGNMCSGTVVDMLSTNLTIDANENKSSTAATPAVINTSNDDLTTDQVIRINIDSAGTGAAGLVVTLRFRNPLS